MGENPAIIVLWIAIVPQLKIEDGIYPEVYCLG